MFPPQIRPLRELTNIKFEIFVVAFTILPFFVLTYFYSLLPERVPQFLTLIGEVETCAPDFRYYRDRIIDRCCRCAFLSLPAAGSEA